MKPVSILLLLAVAWTTFCACRKNTPPLPAAVVEENTPDRLPTAPNDSSLHFPIHLELTSAVQHYRTDYQKLPPDFETLVKEKYVKTMPKPPPGKRFALDRNRMQVVITD